MTSSPRTGATLAVGSMLSVQLGVAVSVGLVARLGVEGVSALRLGWAAVLLVLLARPRPAQFDRAALLACAGLGVVTAGLTLFFLAAVARIPMGTASAIEFLGPLGVAALSGRAGDGRGRLLWPLLAAGGVVALTEPWEGATDPTGIASALAAACCWALYILLTRRVGDRVTGVTGLAVSMPVAALVAVVVTLVVNGGAAPPGTLDLTVVLVGLGLSLLIPVVPFSFEMLALRRLTTTAFGTLMSLEPAIALLIGAVALGQAPGLLGLVGIALVVAAGVGATRGGARQSVEPEARAGPVG